MSRLTAWVKELKESGMNETDIASCIDNGDLERPEWLGSSPCTGIGYAIWDTANSCGDINLYGLDTTLEPTDF